MAADATTESAAQLHGLRPAATSFVGRSGAVDAVAGLLGKYRLVTVTGPGGMGKTRLADEVAKRVADRFSDDVCGVELATIAEPGLVPATVATVLGLRQAPGMSVMDALGAHLARQQLLLVLDKLRARARGRRTVLRGSAPCRRRRPDPGEPAWSR